MQLSKLRPELSGIVLSLINERGADQDGFLRAHEVFDLRLPAEMVVLSGCQTGLGKEVKSEGLIGLTRGFMYAGAARVMVSPWEINDQATSQLMTRLYQGLLGKRRLSPAAALREAQVSFWRDRRWNSPYYWAAFTLQGEPDENDKHGLRLTAYKKQSIVPAEHLEESSRVDASKE